MRQLLDRLITAKAWGLDALWAERHVQRMYLSVSVTDRRGKKLRAYTCKSRSYVRQHNELLYCSMRDVAFSGKDTSGATQSMQPGEYLVGISSSSAYGIQIGMGNTAVIMSDYKLESQIASGSSAGKMEYNACAYTTPYVSGNQCSFTIERTFANHSGGTITVRETGISISNSGKYYCVARDVLPSGVAVADGETLTVTYTIKVSV